MIQSYSKFYYLNVEIDSTNRNIDFNDGQIRTAKLPIGQYSPVQLANAVRVAMNNQSTLTYTVTFNRSDLTYTIAAISGSFKLLLGSGPTSSTSVTGVMGFGTSDTTTATSHTSSTADITVYYPQFYLVEYEPSYNWSERIDPSVNVTSSGKVSVISFGEVRYAQMSFSYITDVYQGSTSPIKNRSNAVQEARNFFNVLSLRRHVEFMEDENNSNVYEIFMLESLASSKNGTGWQLKEMFGRNLGDHYEVKSVKFRKMD